MQWHQVVMQYTVELWGKLFDSNGKTSIESNQFNVV